MADYEQMMRDQYDFLQNHLNLLSSLQTSKAHAGKPVNPPPTTQEVSDGHQHPSEGIPGASVETHA